MEPTNTHARIHFKAGETKVKTQSTISRQNKMQKIKTEATNKQHIIHRENIIKQQMRHRVIIDPVWRSSKPCECDQQEPVMRKKMKWLRPEVGHTMHMERGKCLKGKMHIEGNFQN